ncbi:MAG TPA: phospholipid carrier-dependent glycosyltransferase [Candidatus Humimicrobiaceae bacterium]|nr:phospholipid carrier-dependent glycosyltransferase [Candidatus Humimicrobiaceae bacterium]
MKLRKESFLFRILNSWEIFLLGIFSFFTRFFNLSFPPKVVFDEAHFGLYATKYLSQQYYFDIHPPLGKILLALSGFFGRVQAGFDFAVDSDYGDLNFLALRFLPALFGSLLVLLIYFLVKEMGFSKRIAFLSGFLVLFENALIVQSRFILLDIILIFFIFLSFYLFFLCKRFPVFSAKWYLFNFLTGLSLGVAISIKWTGVGVLAIIWLLAFSEIVLKESFKKANLIKIFSFLVLPLAVYFLIFVIHFSLLPLACTSDCGVVLDHYLENTSSPLYSNFNQPPEGNLFKKFVETNRLMLLGNLSSTMIFNYQSDWYSWPFMIRPVHYFIEAQNDKTSYIFLLGNPITWWLGVIGVIGILYLLIKNYFYSFKLKIPTLFYSDNLGILFLGYFIYLIPFLAIKRFMLIYHYLPALVFSIIIFSVFLNSILETFFSKKKNNFIFFVLLLLIFISFLFFSPLTYGFPLNGEEFQLRMWLPSWSL